MFEKTAICVSVSAARTVMLGCQKPMRLNVHLPSPVWVVASEPKELRKPGVDFTRTA